MEPTRLQSPTTLAVAVKSPFPRCLMKPLAAYLNVCLHPFKQEQAPFTCEETENGPRQISTLAVAAVKLSPRPTSSSSNNQRMTKLIIFSTFPNTHLSGFIPGRCVCYKCLNGIKEEDAIKSGGRREMQESFRYSTDVR